jgi:hypothetical protein
MHRRHRNARLYLADFIVGILVKELCAELTTFVERRRVVVRGNDSVDAAQRWSQPPCDGLRCGRGRSSAMMRCHVREGARPPSPLLLDFRYLRRDEHA